MNKFKKLMSVLVAAFMLLQMAAISGSAEVPGIILDVQENGALAEGVTYSGTKNFNYNANGGMVDWATKGCILLNSASPYVAWKFNILTEGVYDIYIAHGAPRSFPVSAYIGENTDEAVATGVPSIIYPNENGTLSSDSMYYYPMETKIAESVAFKAGENNLKIKANGGTLYNVKLVYRGAIEEIPEEPYVMLSGETATLTSIPAKDFDNKSDDVTVSGEIVTIPKDNTVSYTVNVAEAGAYRIWVRTTSSGTINAELSGIPEVLSFEMGKGISSKAGWKQKYKDINAFVMGVYTISPEENGTQITFSPKSDAKITRIDFIRVDGIPVLAEGETVVNMADYIGQNMSSAGYDSVYIWDNANMPAHLKKNGGYGAPGAMCNLNTWQYVTHELYLEEAGIYKIKGYTSKNAEGKTYDFYLATGNSLEELQTNEPQIINRGGTGAADANIYAFTVNAKANGKFYVTTGFKASSSLHATYNGFTIERIGGHLGVETVKANTSEEELSNNSAVSKGADTFAVKFIREIDKDSVTDSAIGLYDGDTLVDTYKEVEDDTVYLTVKKVLDPQKTYTIKVDGVCDDYNSKVEGYALDITTDANGTAVSSIAEDVKVVNKRIPEASDLNKRDITVSGKILSSKGKGIEGREVILKLEGEEIWKGLSGVDGVFDAKYELPTNVASQSRTYTFKISGDGVKVEKDAVLTYVSAAEESAILGTLKAADAAEVKAFIENPENQEMFDINPKEDMPSYSGFKNDLVYAQLANLDVADVNEFKAAYKKAILLETINQATKNDDALSAVKAILSSSDDLKALGIDKEKVDCIKEENFDAFADAVAEIDVSSDKTNFSEELEALKEAVEAKIDEMLATQYEKTAATSLAETEASAYTGQGFEISLDITPAQSELAKIEYVVEVAETQMIEDAIITTEYDYETEIKGKKLIITIDVNDSTLALSDDLKVGKVMISAPDTQGNSTIKLNGKMSFDVGIPYLIERDITQKTITLTTTKKKEGSIGSSSGGISSRPTVSQKPEVSVPVEKPDNVNPPKEEDKPVSNFKDLAGSEWAVEAINALFEKGIISDNDEKIFRPNDNVTREEFVKMIIEALDLVHEEYETDLKDVDKNAWYYPYVAAAVEKGIVLGDENGAFRVGENISRQDMAVIIIRVISKLEHPYDISGTKFADDEEISDYAKDAMYAARNLSIINGVGENKCAPKGTATRAMAAKVIYEMMRTVGLK